MVSEFVLEKVSDMFFQHLMCLLSMLGLLSSLTLTAWGYLRGPQLAIWIAYFHISVEPPAFAATIYDHLFVGGAIIEVGCWSHCRRYFLKTLTSEPVLANEAVCRRLVTPSPKIARKRCPRSNTPPLSARRTTSFIGCRS